jgi:hypothetical protein
LAGPAADPADNPEINVGTGTVDRSRWGRLIDRFCADLRAFDVGGRRLDVRENVKFQGGAMSAWVHRTFPTTGCALALEFKKSFMDEWSGRVDDEQLAALSRALAATLPGLVESLGHDPAVRTGPPGAALRVPSSLRRRGADATGRRQDGAAGLAWGGRLRVDRPLPFLCLYRAPADRPDLGTAELVRTQASYLIAPAVDGQRADLAALVGGLVEVLADACGACLLLELWSVAG